MLYRVSRAAILKLVDAFFITSQLYLITALFYFFKFSFTLKCDKLSLANVMYVFSFY